MTSTATAVPTVRERVRHQGLDTLRGLAVVLMILDHGLVVAAPGHWLRSTLTRLSLPLFLLVAGALFRPGWRTRYLDVLSAGVAATFIGAPLGIGQPDILLLILGGCLILNVAGRLRVHDLVVVTFGLLAARQGWLEVGTGYGVFEVAGWLALGRLGAFELRAFDLHDRALAAVGRRPLAWYVGHLVALWFLVTGAAIT